MRMTRTWSVEYTDDWILGVYKGLQSIRRTSTESVKDCRVYGGLELGL